MFVWAPDGLNEEQAAAVDEPGHVLLVACPGSGKTRTLTFRIARALSQLTSERQRVVAITYTHRAADEIHERIGQLGVDADKLWVGTIHSFCLEWILRPYALYHERLRDGFRVLNAHDTEAMLADLCRPYAKQRIGPYDCNYHYAPDGIVLSCNSSARATVAGIIARYHQILQANNQIDYEQILYFAFELIEDHPVIARLLSAIFPSILVDEYQDTRKIQYRIIAAIARAARGGSSIFMVGDPNQAIFATLGGYAIAPTELRAMLEADVREMALSQNYRSSARVVRYFGNYKVEPTTIVSAARHKDHRGIISYNDTVSRADLEAKLVELVRHNIEDLGYAPKEICVLAPQWVHLADMTRRLVAALPAYRFDGPGMVPFARDIDNFWYRLSRILLTEPSPSMYVRRLRWAGEVLGDLAAAGVSTQGLIAKIFLRHCNRITLATENGLAYLEQAFRVLFGQLDVDFERFPMLAEHHEAFFTGAQRRIERLQRDGHHFIGGIEAFRRVFESRCGITVSTIHGVKGAEFDVVIAYALLDGLVPHFADPDPDNSARRLLFVICSRARKNLHLVAETGRQRGWQGEYQPTAVLGGYVFDYDPGY